MSVDNYGRTALHYAAFRNDVPEVERLLHLGADPNAKDREGFTPLHLAAQEYAVEAASALLDHGAAVDSVNKYGNTPLFVSVFNSRGRGEMITLLRSRGADAENANDSGQTPVRLARLIGNYDVARFFSDLS